MVHYSSIDEAVEMIQGLVTNAELGICDVKHAIRLLPVAPEDFDLSGFLYRT